MTQQSAFPTPGSSHDDEGLALVHREGDPLQNGASAKRAAKVANFDDGVCHAFPIPT